VNRISQVVPLISHSRSYSPYCSHLHSPSVFLVPNCTIIAEHKVKSSPSSLQGMIMSKHQVQHPPSTPYTEYSIHPVQHTPSTAYYEYSIHRVQHTPTTAYIVYSIRRLHYKRSTAYTHDCRSSLHSHNYELTPEGIISFRCASVQDQPAYHEHSQVKMGSPRSHGCA